MPKKHGFKILSGLFGGFGEAANKWMSAKEKKNMTEEEMLQRLSELSLKQQMGLYNPYKQAMINKMNRPRPLTKWEEQKEMFNKLNPPPEVKSMEDLQSQADLLKQKKISEIMNFANETVSPEGTRTPISPGKVSTVQDLINNQNQEISDYKDTVGSFLGLPSKKDKQLKILMAVLKSSQDAGDYDLEAQTRKEIVNLLGVDLAKKLNIIDEEDINSGVLDEE